MSSVKYKVFWLFGLIALGIVIFALLQTKAYYLSREMQLELANTRIHERLFMQILRNRIQESFPDVRHTTETTGGATGSNGRFEFTTMNDVFFEQSIPPEKLAPLVEDLSTNVEIANWLSLAQENGVSRYCQFVVKAGSEKPCIRMLMHERNYRDGINEAELVKVFSGNYNPDASAKSN